MSHKFKFEMTNFSYLMLFIFHDDDDAVGIVQLLLTYCLFKS
jgi:hypothetical protein